MLNAKYQFKQYFTGGPINLFRKYASNPNFDPPSNIPGHGPDLSDMYLFD